MTFPRSIIPAKSALKPAGARAALLAMHASGAHRIAPGRLKGAGVIFMLHRVREPDGADFAPNRILEVTPGFLDAAICRVRELGYDCVSLDEAVGRLTAGDTSKRFAVFTLDDGYRDNLTVATPVFERHNVPFTVYLATGLPDGTAELWWVALERAVAAAGTLRMRFPEGEKTLPARTAEEKRAAYNHIYWRLRAGGEDAMRAAIRRLAGEHGIGMSDITRELAMSWDEVRALAARPLARIEAHTAGHFALARLPEARAREEIAAGLARHEAELGNRPQHFSYPYGDTRSAGERDFALAGSFGFRSATTTRKGLVEPRHAGRLMSLPRLSLNGDYQDLRIIEVLLSGVPFALGRAVSPGAFG